MSIWLDDGFFMKKYNLTISGFRDFAICQKASN